MINKDMKIGAIIQKYPHSIEIMFKNGLHCVGCHISAQESLEEGCKTHGIDDKKIRSIVNEINKTIKK